ETRTGAVSARVDGLAGWVKDVRNRDRSYSADATGDGKADLVVHTKDGRVAVRTNRNTYFDSGKVMITL
ncbi:hypothetical protein ACFVG1_03740, partial [Streptomyces bacillaris]